MSRLLEELANVLSNARPDLDIFVTKNEDFSILTCVDNEGSELKFSHVGNVIRNNYTGIDYDTDDEETLFESSSDFIAKWY